MNLIYKKREKLFTETIQKGNFSKEREEKIKQFLAFLKTISEEKEIKEQNSLLKCCKRKSSNKKNTR